MLTAKTLVLLLLQGCYSIQKIALQFFLCYNTSIIMIGGDTHYMKLISWNVNGLRACLTKGFPEFFEQEQADIFCIQETKMQEGQA